MNDILELKGRLQTRKGRAFGGLPTFKRSDRISSSHLTSLRNQLVDILTYWRSHPEYEGALVSVHYNGIVAKSNRIQRLLSVRGRAASDSIRGVRFDHPARGLFHHVFTHYVPLSALEKSILELQLAATAVSNGSGESLSGAHIPEVQMGDIEISRSNLLRLLHDALYVSEFTLDAADSHRSDRSIVTIYRTAVEPSQLFSRLGLPRLEEHRLSDTTFLLTPDQYHELASRAPYLVSMGITDLRELSDDSIGIGQSASSSLVCSSPSGDEPVIGVLDTPFDESVDFRAWVEATDCLDPEIPRQAGDKTHGTGVTSIIVDGPRLNPRLDDGCGRFRVRHFGVIPNGRFSACAVMKKIREIVSTNRDIKVWNISFGSTLEVNRNFISPEAAELDMLQNEFDVVFVVAGTNVPPGENRTDMRLGAPADSLNSIVVNSVDFSDSPASYSRSGPVLSFFRKPDFSFYGGDGVTMDGLIAVNNGGCFTVYVRGTSYAAPWISRKLAYLIHVMGYRRDVAKALLIDAAARWSAQNDDKKGYGVIPVAIRDILQSPEDEIRFVFSGVAEDFQTYTYNLPIPVVDGGHPFIARATMVYFPRGDRNQGVDYTSSEMDIQFGRIAGEKLGEESLKSINKNRQGEEATIENNEFQARKLFRKWDNVKHIGEPLRERLLPKKAYPLQMWGLVVTNKARNADGMRESLPFGIVVTLKEIRGVNRIDDFIRACELRGWIVSRVKLAARVQLYQSTQSQVEFK